METRQIQDLKINLVKPDKNQPRKSFDKDALKGLANSIADVGLIQPIIVRKDKKNFIIIAGERRYRAFQLLEEKTIPSIVSDFKSNKIYAIQIIENLQRKDVPIIEESEGIAFLCKTSSAEDIGKSIGRSTSFIYQRLKLANLIDGFKGHLSTKKITIGQGLNIGSFSHDEQKNMLEVLGDDFQNYSVNNVLKSQNSDLEKAPFDLGDTKLVEKAGSCNTCAFNSINQGNLFGEDKKMCTGFACYTLKKQLTLVRMIAKFKKERLKLILNVSNYNLDSENVVVVTDQLKKHNFTIDIIDSINVLYAPVKPTLEEIKENSWEELTKEELDLEYKSELEDYQEELDEYNSDVEKASKCFLLDCSTYQVEEVYFLPKKVFVRGSSTQVSAKKMNECTPEEQIVKIKVNADRKNHLATNKLFVELEDAVDKKKYINQKTPLSKEELKSACITLVEKFVGYSERGALFSGLIGTDKDISKKFDKVKGTPGNINKLLRYIIASNVDFYEENHTNNIVNYGYYQAVHKTHKDEFKKIEDVYSNAEKVRTNRVTERVGELKKKNKD